VREPHLILGIGEMLWDILPEKPALTGVPIEGTTSVGFLGGAPTNFTVMAGRLGNHAAILSRIGRDNLGRLAVDQLDPMPVDTSRLEVDLAHETGRVTVNFVEGEPKYTIHKPAAWDFMGLTDEWVSLAERANAICFGSLAQRSRDSRQTIQTLAAQAPASCIRVFDVNLRPPFYSSDVIEESIELATVLKLNHDELPQVLTMLGLQCEHESNGERLRLGADRLLAEFPTLEMVAVTRGDRGSLLVRREAWNEHPGIAVKTADPIGAGDAFTAAIVHYMLRGADLATLNEAGNRWGSWVASQSGAMPVLPEEVRAAIAASIEE
jgi:fructokinase